MSRQFFTSLLMFAWLTVGFAVVHLLIALWGLSILDFLVGSDVPYENLQVFEEEGPLVQVSRRGSAAQVTYRRLDGSVVKGRVGTAAQSQVDLGRGMHGEPESWDARIAPFIDFESPTVNWYLLFPPDRPGLAYFTGYEQESNRYIGYLGTEGFSNQIPAVEQSFPITPAVKQPLQGNVVATQRNHSYHQAFEPRGGAQNHYIGGLGNSAVDAKLDAVWILSQGTIYEVRLAARTVRKLIEGRPEMQSLARMPTTQAGPLKSYLIVRTVDSLLKIDPETLEETRLAIGTQTPGATEHYAELANGQRMLVNRQYPYSSGIPYLATILWIDAEGQVERRAEVELSYGNTWSPWTACTLLFPAPAASIAAGWIVPLMTPPQRTEPKTYVGRVGYHYRQALVWVASSLMIGVCAAWACRRRECDVFGNRGWFWPVLVGVCGWFGWVGYICLRPLPAKTPQGEWLPARPEPNRPLGTEIFA